MAAKRKEIGSDREKDMDIRSSELSFEIALSRLEQIVTKMEESDLPLDEAMEAYEQGILYIRHCRARLEEAQERIEILEKSPGESKAIRKREVKVKQAEKEPVLDDQLQGTLLELE